VTSQNSELGGRGCLAYADGHSLEARQLAELRWHWDSAYVIDCRDGVWTARFCDGATVLSAECADDLRTVVWDDYSNRKSSAAGPGERALRRLREDGII
jgi:hypothetical protein